MPNTIRSSKSKRRAGPLAADENTATSSKGSKVMRDAMGGKLLVERVLVQKPPRQSDKVELRLSPVAKVRLQAAAAASRKTLSSFLLDSGLERADTVLGDRTLFVLDDALWRAFNVALEAPTQPRPRLARLLKNPSIVE